MAASVFELFNIGMEHAPGLSADPVGGLAVNVIKC